MDGEEHPTGKRPVTFHQVMREALGSDLQKHDQPDEEIPHGLLVLMMQLNDDRRRRPDEE